MVWQTPQHWQMQRPSTELGAKQGAKAAGKPALAPDSPLRLIAGSYGRRQGLSLDAACGPFAHVLVI